MRASILSRTKKFMKKDIESKFERGLMTNLRPLEKDVFFKSLFSILKYFNLLRKYWDR